jgi:DNA repair exonuclease SbcCD ATPase subunit
LTEDYDISKAVDDYYNIVKTAIPYVLFLENDLKNNIIKEIQKLSDYELAGDYDNFYKQIEEIKDLTDFYDCDKRASSLVLAYQEVIADLQEKIQSMQEQINELKDNINVTKGNACVICGTEFTGRAGAKYCSQGCKQAAYRARKQER